MNDGTTTGAPVAPEVAYMTGPEALPRANGELVFDAPWQGRALALALAVTRRQGVGWDAFRSELVAAIAARPGAPYWENWVEALERLVRRYGWRPPAGG